MSARNRPEQDHVVVATRESPLGAMRYAVSAQALLYCGFAAEEMVHRRVRRISRNCMGEHEGVSPGQARILAAAQAQVDEFLAGRSRTFSLPLDLRLATPFCREVILALDHIVSYGMTTTYAELAVRMGRPRAARAVGAALGANPICVVLPCHRVVGASGQLTGYAGGIPAKRFLLGLEARAKAADSDRPTRIAEVS